MILSNCHKTPRHKFSVDVLVIGTGIAGFFAAMSAQAEGASVLLVGDSKSGFTGQSIGGTHRMRVMLPGDDPDQVLRGIVRESEYLIDQDFAASALGETWERIQELQSMGVRFRRGDDGEIEWYYADTQDPDVKQRNIVWEPMGSYKHLLTIKKEALRRGIDIIDRVLVTDLLKSEDRVCGALGFHIRNGDAYIFHAKSVVVATGTFSGGAVANPSLTGDGIAMALRAGAELRNMEFGKAEAGGLPPRAGGPVFIARLLNPQEQEIRIINANGEEFMEKYELGKRLPGRKPYGPPWRVALPAVFKEIEEGRGPCYVDYRVPNKTGREREFWGSYYDRAAFQTELSQTPFDKAIYELGLARGFSQGGGIRITAEGETNVRGLFSAGVASDLCCTVQYAIISGMMASMITGRHAGASAANYASGVNEMWDGAAEIDKLLDTIYEPMSLCSGLTADELRVKITSAWLNIDLRTEERLNKAIADFEDLEKESLNMRADSYHELMKVHKIRNYLQCSQAVAVAALSRRETRLEHYRLDYPLTDNTKVQWIVVYKDGDNITSRAEDVPLEKWKVKPEPIIENRMKEVE